MYSIFLAQYSDDCIVFVLLSHLGTSTIDINIIPISQENKAIFTKVKFCYFTSHAV